MWYEYIYVVSRAQRKLGLDLNLLEEIWFDENYKCIGNF